VPSGAPRAFLSPSRLQCDPRDPGSRKSEVMQTVDANRDLRRAVEWTAIIAAKQATFTVTKGSVGTHSTEPFLFLGRAHSPDALTQFASSVP
jgi:hypothetical protein